MNILKYKYIHISSYKAALYLIYCRLIQYPLLCVLAYYAVSIKVQEGALWTHDKSVKEVNEGMKYCEANEVHIATVTIAFQLIYGMCIIVSWTVLWAVDKDDDDEEATQEKAWQEAQAKEKGTLWGNVKEFVLVVCIQSFFDDSVSGTFMSLALALPHSNCNIHVTEWFLIAGVVATLTEVVNTLRAEVEELANLDGIINLVEHRLIVGLRMLNFPLLVTELVTFVALFYNVIKHGADIEFVRTSHEENPHYCEEGVWKLMQAVVVIYSALFIFRVLILAGSLMSDEEIEEEQQEG